MAKTWLAAASATAIVIGLATGAQAQMPMPGWFGSVTGWYYPWKNTGSSLLAYDSDDVANAGSVKPPGDGFGGRAYLGYRFASPFDFALGFQGTALSRGPTISADLDNEGGIDTLAQKARYWAGDLEVGYTMLGSSHAVRFFIGARLASFNNKTSGMESSGGGPLELNTRFRGVGPRVGFDGAVRLGADSNFSLLAGVSGSVLFGKIKAHGEEGGGQSASEHDKRKAWTGEGHVALGYDLAPNVTLAVGYRGEYWRNVVYTAFEMDEAPVFSQSGGGGNRFMHGPFARVSYNIGAPRGVMPVAAPAPMISVVKPNYIVFFDFDRSNLTPTSLATIKQAADAAKAGKSARVGVTGHADKSGTDAYNMALSLRRANTVKDELVRNGVPAASIVVVGRGESAPLVPTADGVREPQNRRVEIVLQ